MELDHALRYLGGFGRYQILLLLLLNIVASIFTKLQLMGTVFVAYTPKPYYCTPPEGYNVNETVPVILDDGKEVYDSCHMYVVQDGEVTGNVTGCQFGWEFETFHGEQSVVTDYDLVCDDAILAKISQSLFMTGIVVGSVICGQLADIYGRKPVMFVTLVCQAICGLCMALVWNYYAFVVFWFLLGVFDQGLSCAFVMVMEMFSPEKRTLAGSICNVIRGVGDTLVPLIAFGLRNWRHYEMFVSLICLLVLPAWWFIPESARWLISRGRIDEAEAILTKIADFNDIPVPSPSFLSSRPQELREEVVPLRSLHKKTHHSDAIYKPVTSPIEHSDPHRHGHKGHAFSGHKSSTSIAHDKYIPPIPPVRSAKRHTVLDIFKSKVLLKNFFMMCYCWFVGICVFYGLSFFGAELAGNVYVNVFLICLVELPAYILSYFMLNWIGRRLSYTVSFLVTGVFCVLTASLPSESSQDTDMSLVIVALTMIGKCFVTITAAVGYVFLPELLPTDMRNAGFGVCSFFARIGGILAPLLLHLNKISKYLPLNIFGVMALIAGILSLFLPETRNEPLPETLEDCERMGHSSLCSTARDRFTNVKNQEERDDT